jgi:hypothetical protein
VPFLEFSPINHGSELNVKCMQVDNHMKLMACKDIKKGEVIVQQQARASNTDVLLNSGFCAENNQDKNSVVVEASLDPNHPCFALKLELMETTNVNYKFLLRKTFTQRDVYALISFLRFCVYDEDEAYLVLAKTQAMQMAKSQWVRSGRKPEEFNPRGMFTGRELSHISQSNERLTLQKLISICLNAVVKYPQTLQEDLATLAKDDIDHKLSVNERNIIELRSGEKDVLNYMIAMAEKCLTLLEEGITLKEARNRSSLIDDVNV